MRVAVLLVAMTLPLAGCQTSSSVSFQSYNGVSIGEAVTGLLAKPEGKGKGPFPAVVLLHACGGMTQNVTSDWPAYLTSLGYVVLSVDTLGPRGVRDCSKIGGGKIPQSEDAYGALDYLATLPDVDASRIAVMGFSMGSGTITEYLYPGTFSRGRTRDFRAAIALYGRCTLRNEPGDMPLMQIIGELDPGASVCGAVRNRDGFEVQVIPGAYHAFDSPQASGRRDPFGTYMEFSAAATARAHELSRDFFARHLGRPAR